MSNPTGGAKPRAKSKKRRKGQRKPAPSSLALLNRLLLSKVRTSFNGEEREITALEAIICQLIQKEAAGDGRASHVLLKYEDVMRHETHAPLQIMFVESDYTDALADQDPEASDG